MEEIHNGFKEILLFREWSIDGISENHREHKFLSNQWINKLVLKATGNLAELGFEYSQLYWLSARREFLTKHTNLFLDLQWFTSHRIDFFVSTYTSNELFCSYVFNFKSL